jgi:hypothetical protein
MPLSAGPIPAMTNLWDFYIGTHPPKVVLYLVALARVRPGVQRTRQQYEVHKSYHPSYIFQHYANRFWLLAHLHGGSCVSRTTMLGLNRSTQLRRQQPVYWDPASSTLAEATVFEA